MVYHTQDSSHPFIQINFVYKTVSVSVMDKEKGIPECMAMNKRVSDTVTVQSTRGCSDKVVCAENSGVFSIPGTRKAGTESVTWNLKREI